MCNEIESFILRYVKSEGSVNTWWMSDFYEEICNLMGYDFNDIKSTTRKIRYQLNKLVTKGILEKRRIGVGNHSRDTYGHNHAGEWVLKGFYD